MDDGEDRTICIAAPRRPAEAQTFVRAHAERLRQPVGEVWGRNLEHASCAVSPVPVWRHMARLAPGRRAGRLMQALWRREMARFLRRSGVDVVLAEFAPTGAQLAPACRRAGVPLVVHFHGYDAYRYRTVEELKDDYSAMFALCAAVVAVSHDMAQRLVDLGAPPHKVHVCACGADCELFTPTDPAMNPPVFVAVGRLVPVKGPTYLVQAFRRVLDACPEARLLVIGDGPLLTVCRDIVWGLDMANAVELPGALPHAEVAEAMRGARAFVQHSVGTPDVKCEGNPVSAMEAGASGLPAVVTRNGGIPEVVLDGQTGFLVDERDVAGMAERMVELARDPALAGLLGRAGRERVCAEFSLDRSIERLGTILAEAAER